MDDDRLVELAAMFRTAADEFNETHARTYGRKALGRISAIQLHSMALVGLATLSAALVEVTTELTLTRSRLVLLEAHQENLIERTYALEGGDEASE